MEEKPAEASTEPVAPTHSIDAGYLADVEGDGLLPIFFSPKTESTEEVNVAEAPIDTKDDLVDTNLNSSRTLDDEITISGINTEMLSTVPSETTPLIDKLTEETNNEKSSENEEIPTEPMVTDQSEEKEQTQQTNASNAVLQLEEELKRLHGGDTSEETKSDGFMGDLSVTSILEDNLDANQKDIINSTLKSNATVDIKKESEKPIMKDSDLEEMLSAGDVVKDPILLKGW